MISTRPGSNAPAADTLLPVATSAVKATRCWGRKSWALSTATPLVRLSRPVTRQRAESCPDEVDRRLAGYEQDGPVVNSHPEAARVDGWWLCPNEPRCAHGAMFHDVHSDDREWEEDVPTCCVEGCDCGRNGAVRMAR